MSMLPFLIPLYLILYAAFGLYATKSVRRKRVEVEKIVQANTCLLYTSTDPLAYLDLEEYVE